MSAPVVLLSRRYAFSASHRLYADALSPEENEAVFGKCANPNGHGHNYGLTVTVASPVDADTGFVIPLTELDEIVRRRVLDAYDHAYLNLDVEDYANLTPTGENIALMVWERLHGPLGGKLVRVTIDETRNNRFEYPPERAGGDSNSPPLGEMPKAERAPRGEKPPALFPGGRLPKSREGAS